LLHGHPNYEIDTIYGANCEGEKMSVITESIPVIAKVFVVGEEEALNVAIAIKQLIAPEIQTKLYRYHTQTKMWVMEIMADELGPTQSIIRKAKIVDMPGLKQIQWLPMEEYVAS